MFFRLVRESQVTHLRLHLLVVDCLAEDLLSIILTGEPGACVTEALVLAFACCSRSALPGSPGFMPGLNGVENCFFAELPLTFLLDIPNERGVLGLELKYIGVEGKSGAFDPTDEGVIGVEGIALIGVVNGALRLGLRGDETAGIVFEGVASNGGRNGVELAVARSGDLKGFLSLEPADPLAAPKPIGFLKAGPAGLGLGGTTKS